MNAARVEMAGGGGRNSLAPLSLLENVPKKIEAGKQQYEFDKASALPFLSDSLRAPSFQATLASLVPQPKESMKNRWDTAKLDAHFKSIGIKPEKANDLMREIVHRYPGISKEDLRTMNSLVLAASKDISPHGAFLLPEDTSTQRISGVVGAIALELADTHQSARLASIVKDTTPSEHVDGEVEYDFSKSTWDVLTVSALRDNLNLSLVTRPMEKSLTDMGLSAEIRKVTGGKDLVRSGKKQFTFVGAAIFTQFPNITREDCRVIEQLVDHIVATTPDPETHKPPLQLINKDDLDGKNGDDWKGIKSRQRIVDVVSVVYRTLQDSQKEKKIVATPEATPVVPSAQDLELPSESESLSAPQVREPKTAPVAEALSSSLTVDARLPDATVPRTEAPQEGLGAHGVYLTPLVSEGVTIGGRRLSHIDFDNAVVSPKSQSQARESIRSLWDIKQGLVRNMDPRLEQVQKNKLALIKVIGASYIQPDEAMWESLSQIPSIAHAGREGYEDSMGYLRYLVEERVGNEILHDEARLFPQAHLHTDMIRDMIEYSLQHNGDDFGLQQKILDTIPSGTLAAGDTRGDTYLLARLLRQMVSLSDAQTVLRINELLKRFS